MRFEYWGNLNDSFMEAVIEILVIEECLLFYVLERKLCWRKTNFQYRYHDYNQFQLFALCFVHLVN